MKLSMGGFKDAIVHFGEANGADHLQDRGLRFCVHEVAHALDLYVPKGQWDSDGIHAVVMDLAPHVGMRSEMLARAIEWLVFDHFGLSYETDHWALVSLLEAAKRSNLRCGMPEFKKGVLEIKKSRRARSILDELFKGVERFHAEREAMS